VTWPCQCSSPVCVKAIAYVLAYGTKDAGSVVIKGLDVRVSSSCAWHQVVFLRQAAMGYALSTPSVVNGMGLNKINTNELD